MVSGMPVPLSNTVRRALTDGHLSTDDVTQLKQAVAAGQVKPEELATLAQKFGDLFDVGAGKALAAISPPQAHVVIAAPIRSLGDSRAAAEVLNGHLTLAQGSPAPKEAILAFQHGLNALSSRLGKPAWGLPTSGVDGGFGNETTAAVKAFQQDSGLPVTGAIDQRTALALEHQLVLHGPPDIGGLTGPQLSVPNGDTIAQAAKDLIASRGADYGIAPAWKSPNPSVPGNTTPGKSALGATDHWKCNLFGMDSLFAGGAKPPQYPGGSYPIAIEIPNYAKGPNAPLIELGEVWPEQTANAKDKIDALLKIARPGDVIIVKHHGGATADGGHTRVVVGNSYDQNGTVDCAQASFDAAVVEPENLGSFTGEVAFYLLRPAVSR